MSVQRLTAEFVLTTSLPTLVQRRVEARIVDPFHVLCESMPPGTRAEMIDGVVRQ